MFRDTFGAPRVSSVPTGVDIDYFANPAPTAAPVADLVFVGSMDWMPNVDGMKWFAAEILPLIRQRLPACSVAIVGRTPVPEILEMGRRDQRIQVTGTVPDVRPYLWGSKLSIVPLRIGGGTRLKIYESMAARTPIVSTTIGAEGLEVQSSDNVYLADTPESFANRCVELLTSTDRRAAMAEAAWRMVAEKYSWETVTAEFERILLSARVR
jgi:glycosyltransferase involved in cell wall biosynthesis